MRRMVWVVVLALVGGAGLVAASNVVDERCWSTSAGAEICVPVSVLQATFARWQPGDISPLSQEEAAHFDTFAKWQNAEHVIAKLRAEVASLRMPVASDDLERRRKIWLDGVKAAAPPCTVFDEVLGKYVPKTGCTPDKGGGMP